jgi:mycofactocin precursor
MPESATELLDPPAVAAPEQEAPVQDTAAQPLEVVADDLLVEEISIDGMCGVY